MPSRYGTLALLIFCGAAQLTVAPAVAQSETGFKSAGLEANRAPLRMAQSTHGKRALTGIVAASRLDARTLSATISGQRIFDSNDELIGRVHSVKGAGPKAEVKISLRGFLGFGDRVVAVSARDVAINFDSAGDVLQVILGIPMNALMDLPSTPIR